VILKNFQLAKSSYFLQKVTPYQTSRYGLNWFIKAMAFEKVCQFFLDKISHISR